MKSPLKRDKVEDVFFSKRCQSIVKHGCENIGLSQTSAKTSHHKSCEFSNVYARTTRSHFMAAHATIHRACSCKLKALLSLLLQCLRNTIPLKMSKNQIPVSKSHYPTLNQTTAVSHLFQQVDEKLYIDRYRQGCNQI